MKRRFFLSLLTFALLASLCSAEEPSARAPEKEVVFDAALGRKKLRIEIASRRELGGEAGLEPSKVDDDKLAQLYRELSVPVFSGSTYRFTDTIGRKIYNSFFIYTDKGQNTYLSAFRKSINTFLANDTLNRSRRTRSNARWFKNKGPELQSDLEKFDDAFYEGHAYTWKKAEEVVARFRKYDLPFTGNDPKGTDFVYMSHVVEQGGLNAYLSITGVKASFKNKLHDLDFHIKTARDQLKDYAKDLEPVIADIDAARNLLAELRARIMTDPDCTDEINPLLDQDQAVLDNLARLCEQMLENLEYLKKGDGAAPLILNKPQQAKYAFQKGPHGDLPEFEKKAAAAFAWLKKEMDTWNRHIERELK